MVTNHAFAEPSGHYEDFRQKMINAEKWVQGFEEDAEVGLSGEIRKEIAGTLVNSDTLPLVTLDKLKTDLLKEHPSQPVKKVLDKMTDYYKSVTSEAIENKLLELETLEDFQKYIDDSLATTIHAASSGMEFKKAQRIIEVAFRIKEIFWQLDSELGIGIITSDLEALQKEIDFYVNILRFDGRIFNNAVDKYYQLAKDSDK